MYADFGPDPGVNLSFIFILTLGTDGVSLPGLYVIQINTDCSTYGIQNQYDNNDKPKVLVCEVCRIQLFGIGFIFCSLCIRC